MRSAKEMLSAQGSCLVFVPGADAPFAVTVTAAELHELIGDHVDRSVALLIAAITDAGFTPDQLAGVYLTGGSSRIPLVHSRVWEATGIEPTTRADPKLVVAEGAARVGMAQLRDTPASSGP